MLSFKHLIMLNLLKGYFTFSCIFKFIIVITSVHMCAPVKEHVCERRWPEDLLGLVLWTKAAGLSSLCYDTPSLWVLGTKLRSFAIALSVLTYRAISLAPFLSLTPPPPVHLYIPVNLTLTHISVWSSQACTPRSQEASSTELEGTMCPHARTRLQAHLSFILYK